MVLFTNMYRFPQHQLAALDAFGNGPASLILLTAILSLTLGIPLYRILLVTVKLPKSLSFFLSFLETVLTSTVKF